MNMDKLSVKDLKKTKIYKTLSQKCRSSKLTKVELINLLKDNSNIISDKKCNNQYNILYDIDDFDLDNGMKIGSGASSDVFEEALVVGRKIIRELEKVDLCYPPKVRMKLRTKYNERLKIY